MHSNRGWSGSDLEVSVMLLFKKFIPPVLRRCSVFARHEETIHQLYLQLRSDLLDDRFSCTTEQASHLGALALRVEYGDTCQFDEASVEHYIAPSVLCGPARTGFYSSLMCEYDRLVELTQDVARLQFIQVCLT